MTEEKHNMANSQGQPELKQVLGALLFAARKPITVDELRGVLTQMDHSGEDAVHPFSKIQESNIRTALEQVQTEIAERKLGIILVEVAGGFRFQTDPAGGPWVRQLLNLDKPARLSKPALETLAIIAYRQPTTRAEIEALRGVNVDAMMRHLLELQLIRIMGRSDLPGRPLMYGTTQLFLEHFGLSSVKNLPGVEQLSRRDAERVKRGNDAGHQTPDASSEKTEDGVSGDVSDDVSGEALAKTEALVKAGRQVTDDGRQTPRDAGQATDLSRATRDDGQPTEEEEEEEEEAEENEDDEDEDEDEDGKEE